MNDTTSASAVSRALARAGLRPVASRAKEGLHVSNGGPVGHPRVGCTIDNLRHAIATSALAAEALEDAGYVVHRSSPIAFTVSKGA